MISSVRKTCSCPLDDSHHRDWSWIFNPSAATSCQLLWAGRRVPPCSAGYSAPRPVSLRPAEQQLEEFDKPIFKGWQLTFRLCIELIQYMIGAFKLGSWNGPWNRDQERSWYGLTQENRDTRWYKPKRSNKQYPRQKRGAIVRDITVWTNTRGDTTRKVKRRDLTTLHINQPNVIKQTIILRSTLDEPRKLPSKHPRFGRLPRVTGGTWGVSFSSRSSNKYIKEPQFVTDVRREFFER